MDPIAEKAQFALDIAVADLRDFMARARRLRLQFDHAKNEELTAYRKVQAAQEALQYCYANNPFGGMNDIIERRKSQLAEAERAWQETTLYVAQLRSEVAEISEMEIERFTPEVAERMREQDGEELACANEMIVDGTTNETAPRSLEAIKIVSKEGDIRTAMVFGNSESRPLTAADRTLALSLSSPSHGESLLVAGRIGSPSHYASTSSSPQLALLPPRPSSSLAAGSPTRALALQNSTSSPSRTTAAGHRIGSAVASTSRHTSPKMPHYPELISSVAASNRSAIVEDPHTSGLRPATSGLPSAIRGSAQSPMKMTSVNFRDGKDPAPVVVARPGNYKEQAALLASSDAAEHPTSPAGRLNHLAALDSSNPEAYKSASSLPPIALSPSQQRALQHSPFFRPGSALVYAAADATAVAAQLEGNLDNSKCIPMNAQQVNRDSRPLSRPAYYASPAAERVKYSVTTPNTPLTETELTSLFHSLDGDTDGLLTMTEVARHFDKIGTFGIPNHSKKFIQTSLKRPFLADDLVSYDEFSYLVAKWGTL